MSKYSSQIAALDAPAKPSKYAGAIAALDAPQLKQEEQEQAPGFYSPEEVAKRTAMGAINTLPGAAALMNKAQGKDAYQGDSTERGSAMLGDASNAALTALTLGKGLGLGSVIGGVLEGSGINEGLRKTGRGAEEGINSAIATEAPSKLLGIEGLGMAANVATRIPGSLADIAANLLPAILAGSPKVRGAVGKVIPEALKPSGPAPIAPEIASRASFAAKEGIPLTQGETLGKTSPEAVREAGYKGIQGGEKAALDMQAKQQAAIREGLAKRTMGDDVLAGEIRQGGGMTEGRQLADVPEAARALRSERGAAVGAAKEALSQEVPIRSNFAKELSGTIDEALAKLSNAGPSSNRAKVATLLEGYKDQARKVKTMKGAIDFLDDFDSAIKGTFDREAPNVQKVHLAEVRNKILDVLDEAGTQIAPEAQKALKTAKAGFREVADPAQELRGLEENNPASLLRSISSGNKSLSKVQGFHKVFEAGSPQRQGLKSALVQDIIKKGTQKEGISGSAMVKALEKLDQGTLQEVFSDNPKELADLKQFVKGLSDIEAQRTPLGTSPSGNSHTAPLLKAIGSVAGLKIPGAGYLMEKYQNYKSGQAFKPYELKAKAPVAKETKSMQGLQDRFGLNPALFGRQLAAQAQ